jgi:extracellular elastinolytic metalloproteinase
MTREIDRRDPNLNLVTPEREQDLHAQAATTARNLPGVLSATITRFDPQTGNPSAIEFRTGQPFSSRTTDSVSTPARASSVFAASEDGRFAQRALTAVRQSGPLLGLKPGQAAEYTTSGNVQSTSRGGHAVYLQQEHLGIPIYDATLTVRFGPRQAISSIVGRSVSVPPDLSPVPRLPVSNAALIAARHITTPDRKEPELDVFGEPIPVPAVDLTGFVPTVLATFRNKPEQPTILDGGPLGDTIQGSLRWFPLGRALRLTWDFGLSLPESGGRFHVMVDAEDGTILFATRVT